ncbi:MAG: hypothetical protein IJ066_01645 [Bacteroidaceae bacterium]|nr:hypothetical protein [Bacteroidaceae bacterium]
MAEMKHFRPLLLAASLLTMPLPTIAQTDITAQYLTNPSFEADAAACTDGVKKSESADGLRGWDVSAITGWSTTRPDKQLLITADCFTDNNFGKTPMADGSYALFQRMGWTGGSSTIRQTLTTALPAGTYLLKLKTKAYYANSATSSATLQVSAAGKSLGSTGFAFDQGSAGCMASGEWTEQSLRFKTEASTKAEILLSITWVSGGSQIAVDDVRLFSVPDGYVEPAIVGGRETDVASPTEGVITHKFVAEAEMMQDLLQMLTNHLTYMKSLYTPCTSPTSKGEACGYFKDTEGSNNDEKVVRPNADFSMVCAFLYKYAQGKTTLPAGITWDEVKEMALKSLIWGYSSHKANKFKVTSRNAYWGSVSTSDNTWESSLWAMSLCYAAHFLKDELTDTQRAYIYNMVKAECNYELGRGIPTGYAGDTKAEENGWEADILACALGLYPDDPLAARWFDRLRDFAINSYSQADDATDQTVIDPEYDQKTVASYYRGANLYDDFTLQNHNLFHTSYQNVVQQELGEAHLAMLLFQGDKLKWKTNALMHNQQKVMDEVLNRLALADGELAMPNGNDWSLFLFDQITSYSTMACFLRDRNALLLENMAYKFIKARQQTTSDGSWLLRSDVGSRRMGVEAHRVMMTYLMHAAASTANLQPSTWKEFSEEYEYAHLFRSQNIVRASSKDRFVTFSWSEGLKSYTGYFTDTTPDRNKIICPFRANNTGNILGWYNVSGKGTNATPVVNGIYHLEGNAFTMNGRINTNDATLENSFVLAATRGNAIVYMNHVRGLQNGTITGRRGGLLAITTDEFTRPQRTLYHAGGRTQTDGKKTTQFEAAWANIDNTIGIATVGGTGQMAFGEQANNNSILCSKFYPLYSAQNETFTKDKVVDRSAVVYFSQVDSAQTAALAAQIIPLAEQLPAGWNGLIVSDPDGERNLIVTNLAGGSKNKAELKDLTFEGLGAPVLHSETFVTDSKGTATIALDENHSLMQPLTMFVRGTGIAAKAFNDNDDAQIYVRNIGQGKQKVTVSYLCEGKTYSNDIELESLGTTIVRFDDGQIYAYQEELEPAEWVDVTAQYIANPNFEEDKTWGTTGNITLNGTTYNPCYTQTVKAADSQFPQVLPVEGWTAESTLSPASKFALLYSMPYSFTQYCVSPSSVGNSASIMAVPAAFEDSVGTRCLSILNSWTVGTNAISQQIQLPQGGHYLLTFDLRYDCPAESRRTAPNVITTTGGNQNTLLCGVETGGQQVYAPYPDAAGTWQQMAVPFELAETEDVKTVTIRLGLSTTANTGAANQTRLYIDNVRLLQLKELYDSVSLLPAGETSAKASAAGSYDLNGRPLKRLPASGFFIQDGHKVVR